MRRHFLASLFALTLAATSAQVAALANDPKDEDTETRMVAAKVVEITDTRISVIARSGVEHVIAVDRADTKVELDGQPVALKELREGDVVTVVLDEKNPLKFAKNIDAASRGGASQVARARPRP